MCSQSLFIHDFADLEVSLLKIPMEERIKVIFCFLTIMSLVTIHVHGAV